MSAEGRMWRGEIYYFKNLCYIVLKFASLFLVWQLNKEEFEV